MTRQTNQANQANHHESRHRDATSSSQEVLDLKDDSCAAAPVIRLGQPECQPVGAVHTGAALPELGEDGLRVEGPDAVLTHLGEDLARVPLANTLGGIDPAQDAGTNEHQLTALFPEHNFSYSPPLLIVTATAMLGTQGLRSDLRDQDLDLSTLYEPSLYTAFDGEVCLTLEDGAVLTATFQEWRKNVANLDAFPPNYRRAIQLSLPESLAANREDTVLLLRLGHLVCDLIGSYVESDGQVYEARTEKLLTNVFRGGEAPSPANAPVLYGRKTNDAYTPGPENAALPG